MQHGTRFALGVLLACACAQPAQAARAPSPRVDLTVVQDCREGGDFIRNAALSRDNGMSRADFLARLRDDFEVVRAFPPALRWFVHTPEDERFLEAETARVFDAPEPADQHRAAFVARCLQRAPPG